MKNAEIDNETYQRQIRESEYTIQDLEQKLESNLEQLALIQWELEEYKMHTQEQLERLNQQKREAETELQVKENEVKKLKYQIIALEQAGDSNRRSSLKNGGLHSKAKKSLT